MIGTTDCLAGRAKDELTGLHDERVVIRDRDGAHVADEGLRQFRIEDREFAVLVELEDVAETQIHGRRMDMLKHLLLWGIYFDAPRFDRLPDITIRENHT